MNNKKPQTMCDNYVIERTIGRGQHAKVKLAKDSNNRFVAIKILNESHSSIETVSELTHEIRTLKELRHPNLIHMLGYNQNMLYQKKNGKKRTGVCMVLEYAAGGDLYEYLAQTGRFKEEVARFYFKQLISGLDYITHQKYAHRDIKPENLLLDAEFNLKISDFGVATMLERNIPRETKRKQGSKGYTAPEINDHIEYDAEKADLFSAGVVLLMMITGAKPFSDAQPSDPTYNLMMTGKSELFWSFHSKSLWNHSMFDQEFKEMMNGLLTPFPEQRFDHRQLARCQWLQGPTATLSEIQQEFKARKAIIDNQIQKQQLQQQNSQAKKPASNLQHGIGKFRSGLHISKYQEVLARIDPIFKITSGQRVIKESTEEDLQNRFYSLIDKDELFTFILDYTSTTHTKDDYDQEYHLIKVSDKKYKVEFCNKSDEFEEVLKMQVQLYESGDLIRVIFIKVSGDALFYHQTVLEIQNYIRGLVADQ